MGHTDCSGPPGTRQKPGGGPAQSWGIPPTPLSRPEEVRSKAPSAHQLCG